MFKYINLDPSFQGVNRLFVMAYNRTNGQPTRNGNNKVIIGKGEDYTTGSLLDFNYFDKHYKLVAVDLSKQKELDAKSKETILEFYKEIVKVY